MEDRLFPGRIARPPLAAEIRKDRMDKEFRNGGTNRITNQESSGQQGTVARDKSVIIANETGASYLSKGGRPEDWQSGGSEERSKQH